MDVSQRMNHVACALNPTNYFVVVVLPSRQIKRVARLAASNYERCVFVTIFSGYKMRIRGSQIITIDELITKKNGCSDLIDSKIKIRAEIHFTGIYQTVRGLRPTLSTQYGVLRNPGKNIYFGRLSNDLFMKPVSQKSQKLRYKQCQQRTCSNFK